MPHPPVFRCTLAALTAAGGGSPGASAHPIHSWIASRSLSSGAHSRDPVSHKNVPEFAEFISLRHFKSSLGRRSS
jgi:hypothetical protein